ncbi:phosphate:H+ symporter [Cordyceps militaris CM01]|uniref:Phosphate:H+ symporter n=1 Tax=Cordyceps militaris (strain CM01) TaxID=983644 RepID=G3JU18_CORMM|nr:phosphate:H+ symporter [Cordyceps militaris CM01]EGX88172.1 phosphate:H+ symporter [Cordyceps militaris CM01]
MPASSDHMLPPPAQAPINPMYTRGGNRAFHNYYNDYSHIADANLRRRLALSDVDKVPFGTCHVRAVLVAGAGFLLDSYSIFAINFVIPLVGLAYYSEEGDGSGDMPETISQSLKASTSAGIVIGMILFGWLADTYGRRRMYGIELGVVIFTIFSCAIASESPSMSGPGVLIFWRVLLVRLFMPAFQLETNFQQGIGVGGDYPLASVITSEFAPTRWRGALVAAVFSMQGLGQLMAAVVALITTVAFQGSYDGIGPNGTCDAACRVAADRSWRIIVGVGAIPACLAMYYRITIPETPRYTFDVQHDVDRADADIRAYVSSTRPKDVVSTNNAHYHSSTLSIPKASWADAKEFFLKPHNMRAMVGTTLSWFFLDLAFYGLGLNNSVVLHAIGYASGQTLYHKLRNRALGLIILTSAGSLPGYWTAILTIDTVGRKPLQVFGFLLLTAVFCILGFALHSLTERSTLALYIVGQFLFNAGPNTTTFILPAECFPTRYRATAHGISAAMGKIGAIVAQVISIPLLKQGSTTAAASCKGSHCPQSMDRLLQLFALFMLLGTLVSLLIPETKGITLEELSGEAHTSYNDGCNGSVKAFRRPRAWWHPVELLGFCGAGEPAGFNRRSFCWGGSRHGSRNHQSPRLGIMSSPQMVGASPEATDKTRSPQWRVLGRRDKRKLHSTADSEDIAMMRRDAGTGPARDDASDETAYVGADNSRTNVGAMTTAVGNVDAPAWGAGWGRIDRGRTAPSSELQDVGMLLRNQ